MHNIMKLIIFGGTGFIGRALTSSKILHDYEIYLVSRSPEKIAKSAFKGIHFIQYSTSPDSELAGLFSDEYALINLAGESIAGGLWTKNRKQKILQSRISISTEISDMVNRSKDKPIVILQGSATGFYGSRGDTIINESTPKGLGFLADVTYAWENALQIDDRDKTRIVYLRTGLVLGKQGGLLSKLKVPFLFFAGGHLGNGKQWMPWIHMDDEIGAIHFLLRQNNAKGIFNLCSPEPVTMKMLCKSLGKTLHRVSWLHVPGWLLKVLLGIFAEELLLSSQKVYPENLSLAGYKFKYMNIQEALNSILIK